jgi:hypothetical protein
LPDWLPDRWDPAFEGLSGYQLYETLEGATLAEMADEGHPVPAEWTGPLRRDLDRWRFHFLVNWGEQFDGYSAFLVCPPTGRPLVLSNRFEDLFGAVEVSREGLLGAAGQFVRWFEAESTWLGNPF